MSLTKTAGTRIPKTIVSTKAIDEELAALRPSLQPNAPRSSREWALQRADLLLDRRLELREKGW